MVNFKSFISGCAGSALTDDERALFAEARPCGLILFARNCQSVAQLRALAAQFRDAVESDEALVLIDQEGGRVQRLRPPHWRQMPPARVYGDLYLYDREGARAASFAGARLIAAELRDAGITVNCTPVLDVPEAGSHDIIGDRAFSFDPDVVGDLGRAVIEGTLAGGVLPVIKHVPGHGRARADSHLALPRIDASAEELIEVDFRPFMALCHAPLAMTAHVLLPAFDEKRPASVSPVIMGEVIRELIGLTGLVMSDDIGMKALGGSMTDRAAAVIAAGCDVALHCSGAFDEMSEVARAVPPLEGESAERLASAIAELGQPQAFDADQALVLVREAGGSGSVA
ncbi:beta-N-acetylhexosaminidase [Methyloceanibacter sp.]|uniref:beta-N-acetylhexosaminidase n=1 Tax=Methyloceanibacter sp. TaxID=1965321 RepID=UPI003D6D8FE6